MSVTYISEGDSATPEFMNTTLNRVSGGIFNVKSFGAIGDGVTDDTAAIQAALNTHRSIYLPFGTYRITSPIEVGTQKQIIGAGGGMFNTKRTVLKGTLADMGEGVPLLRLNSGDSTNVQDILIQGIHFSGDNSSIIFSDLSAAVDEGVVGIDVTHVKDHVVVKDCSFRRLKRAFGSRTVLDYIAQVHIENCNIDVCYGAIDFNTETPIYINNSDVQNCPFWIRGTRVSAVNTTFNNSSFSRNDCNIQADVISSVGCWYEKGNNYLDVSLATNGQIFAAGNIFSFAAGSAGDVKHVVKFANNAQVVLVGNHSSEFNRIGDGAAVTNWSTVSISMLGNYWGTYDWDNTGTNPLTEGAAFMSLDVVRRLVSSLEVRNVPYLNFKDRAGVNANAQGRLSGNRTFTLTFPSAASSVSPRASLKIAVVGTNNGAGGSAAYYGEYVLVRSAGNQWEEKFIGGDDFWDFTISNTADTSFDLSIAANASHAGNDGLDRPIFLERTVDFVISP